MEQTRIAEGGLYRVVSGDGGSEGEGMEGQVWKRTGQEGESKFDGRDECGFEATRKRRCPRVHTDTGTFFVTIVLLLLLIWMLFRSQWDLISRRWRQRENVQTLGLLIADEVQMVGGEVGPTYEVVISRTSRYVERQTGNKTRIVVCGVSLANAEDFGKWMGASEHTISNFSPRFVDVIPCLFVFIFTVFDFFSARPLDMAIHIQSFTINDFPSLMIAMSKPAIKEHSPTKPVVIFVPSRRQCRLTVDDLLTHCAADENSDLSLNIELEDLHPHLDLINDKSLVEILKHGIGYYHEALNKQDKRIVQRLFESGAIQVLVASKVSRCSFVAHTFD